MTIVIQQACVQVRKPRAWPVYAMAAGVLAGMLSAVGAL